MLAIQDLFFSYSSTQTILRGISCNIPLGKSIGLIGANGCGKSTLLALLAGIYSPGKGKIQIDISGHKQKKSSLRRLTGLLLQDADLQIIGSTVGEDLLLGLTKTDVSPEKKARDMAARFDLLPFWDLPVQNLSGGQKRKLCLATTLLKSPQILLFDEPFSGLDYPGGKELRSILRQNREQEITQIISGHDLEPFLDLVDFLALMYQGQLISLAPPQEVLPVVEKYSVRCPCSWRAGLGIMTWEGK